MHDQRFIIAIASSGNDSSRQQALHSQSPILRMSNSPASVGRKNNPTLRFNTKMLSPVHPQQVDKRREEKQSYIEIQHQNVVPSTPSTSGQRDHSQMWILFSSLKGAIQELYHLPVPSAPLIWGFGAKRVVVKSVAPVICIIDSLKYRNSYQEADPCPIFFGSTVMINLTNNPDEFRHWMADWRYEVRCLECPRRCMACRAMSPRGPWSARPAQTQDIIPRPGYEIERDLEGTSEDIWRENIRRWWEISLSIWRQAINYNSNPNAYPSGFRNLSCKQIEQFGQTNNSYFRKATINVKVASNWSNFCKLGEMSTETLRGTVATVNNSEFESLVSWDMYSI